MFKCISCNLKKNIEDFPTAPTKIGHKKQCRSCWSAYMREYYQKNPTKYIKHKKYVRNNDLKYKRSYARHHITLEKFESMLDKYDGRCYSCKERIATCIDHDHKCCKGPYSCGNCIRGLLCNWCNSALGQVNDSVEDLYKLIDYLKSTRQ